jgi:methylenetetrahydrofolate reductase (NADPH)
MTASSAVAVSFEVYPPRTPNKMPALQESIKILNRVDPDFISVTFGAGGSSTRDSLEVLRFIRDHSVATPLAHLTCVGTTRNEANALVSSFLDEGIDHFLALRGDLPESSSEHHGELEHASDLVELMMALDHHQRRPHTVAVAAFPNGHPESASKEADIETLLLKQQAGASLAITQLFFYTEDYLSFVESARSAGVEIPILPGLMPITSPGRLERVLELSGEKNPSELATALAGAHTTEAREEIGVTWSANMVRELVATGVPGIHLYAFNQHRTVLSVVERAGVR